MTTSKVEARVQALIEQIRIFARLRIQETKTAASDDFRATEQCFERLESAIRAEVSGKDAERLKAAFFDGFGSYETPCVAMNTVEDAWRDSSTFAAIQSTKEKS